MCFLPKNHFEERAMPYIRRCHHAHERRLMRELSYDLFADVAHFQHFWSYLNTALVFLKSDDLEMLLNFNSNILEAAILQTHDPYKWNLEFYARYYRFCSLHRILDLNIFLVRRVFRHRHLWQPLLSFYL